MKWFLLGILFTVLVVTGVYFYLNYTSNFSFVMGDSQATDTMNGSGMMMTLESMKTDLMDIKMMLSTTASTTTTTTTVDTTTNTTGAMDKTGTTLKIN